MEKRTRRAGTTRSAAHVASVQSRRNYRNFNAPPTFDCRMALTSNDLHVYTPENLLEQAAKAEDRLGYRILRFYVDEHGMLAKVPTDQTALFYYSPSGGTLRDGDLNIVLYSAKFDLYKGFGRA
jgi:hypothetical protein